MDQMLRCILKYERNFSKYVCSKFNTEVYNYEWSGRERASQEKQVFGDLLGYVYTTTSIQGMILALGHIAHGNSCLYYSSWHCLE